jgi:kynurenine formamidase
MFYNYELIDLTLTLSEKLPTTWPVHMPFQRKNWNWYSTVTSENGIEKESKFGPYYTEWFLMDEHAGTHFDAPSHFIPHPESGFANASQAGLITGEKVDLNKLVGYAVVIDVSAMTGTGNPGESPIITKEFLEEWQNEHGPIESGSVVLFYSGWDRFFLPGEKGKAYSYDTYYQKTPGWPTPNAEAVDWLFERGVRCLGTDGVSIGAAHEGVSAHVAGLTKEMAYVESLTQLDKLPVRGAYFIFLPIKIEGSSGGPGRAIAWIPKK